MNARAMAGLAPDSTYVDVKEVPWQATRFPGVEWIYVLEGSFADHAGVCTEGNYVWRRAGSRHEAWTDEGCLMLAVFLKPNTFLDQPVPGTGAVFE